MLLTLKKLAAGQSLLRIAMNRSFETIALSGAVVDVGGGREPDYYDYFDTRDVQSITPVDGSISGIDFERDRLPFSDASVDTVVCANVLEHIYEYRHLVSEMKRILREGGMLAGFVPFLMQYHPDPLDYFRYTSTALERIFAAAGFADIRIKAVGGGPFAANFNNLVFSLPRPLRVLAYPCYAMLDAAFLAVRPSARERFPLGFTFSMRA